jgi:alpha-galactosidase/6-phospho-beta-glucosidase family protein
MTLKIAMIGAGSIGFTRRLLHNPLVGVVCNSEEV